MPSLWIAALKEFNMGGKSWCIPKKGTEDYDKVRALMGGKAVKDAKTEKKVETPKKVPTPKKAEKIMEKHVEMAKKEIKAETPKKVETPKISSLPEGIRKSMREKLSGMEETHEYNAGLGHPINYISTMLSKFRGQETYFGKNYDKARAFLDAVEKYIKSKSINGTYNGKSHKIILISDWEKIF
jgi:hypothetical protein